jgi:hypothetical protein
MSSRAVLAGVESFLGVSIEKDIVSLLGDTHGIVFAGLQSAGLKQGPSFAVPHVYGFCELKDSAKMQETMARIMQHGIVNANQFFRMMEEMKKTRATHGEGGQDTQPGVDSGSQSVAAGSQEEKQYLKLNTDEYQGVTIYSIAVKDFPLDSVMANYCFLGKYLIVSSSPELTRRIIYLYGDKRTSSTISSALELIKKNIVADYSDIAVLNVHELITNIRSTGLLDLLSMPIPGGTQKVPSKSDIESFLGLLGDITTAVYSSRTLDSETTESSFYVGIEGVCK